MKNKRLTLGMPAPDLTLLHQSGHPVRFSELWAKGPVFFSFLRHFG
ncbi:MAG: hypothetical protein U0694_14085 [Anaerolineae bacterium]